MKSAEVFRCAGVKFTSFGPAGSHHVSEWESGQESVWVSKPAKDEPGEKGPWLWGYVGQRKAAGGGYATKFTAARAALRASGRR